MMPRSLLFGSKAGVGPFFVRRLPGHGDLRSAGGADQLLQQLRPLTISPRSLIPRLVILNALAGAAIRSTAKGENCCGLALCSRDHVRTRLLSRRGEGEVGRSTTSADENERRNIRCVETIAPSSNRLKPKNTPYSQQIAFVTDRTGPRCAATPFDPAAFAEELGWRPLRDGRGRTREDGCSGICDNEGLGRALQGARAWQTAGDGEMDR